MDLREKLEGFPNVYYVTLEESADRHKFMQEQSEKYGINIIPFYTKRLNELNQPFFGMHADKIGFCVGVSISHINSLKHWYYNTDEEIAIFCEDDHDFSNVEYWSFTWKQFIQSLPNNWECVQLMRIVSPLGDGFINELKLDVRYGRWWGSLGLMKRSWVKKVLDRHIMEDGSYKMEVAWAEPFAENVLFWDIGTIYNIPLFTENTNLEVTVKPNNLEEYVINKIPHRVSEVLVKDYWKFLGNNININELMRNIK